ncbi:MAG: carbon storage regulator [Planctomycetia bacterium]|nr:carbon storage regulator [Planctomycetia bacterium]
MLVLTRKAKQQIQIGPHITITILQIKGQAVRIGVEAPREICVLRTEIAEKLAGESCDPTIMAALDKARRESAISSRPINEDRRGQTRPSTDKSLRCRAPHVEVAPLSSSHQSTGPASFLRPRRHRLAFR